MNKLILKDMLGAFGDNAVKDIKKKHDKMVQKQKRKLELIEIAVNNLENKMESHRTILVKIVERAKTKTFVKKNISWRNSYKAIMDAKRRN